MTSITANMALFLGILGAALGCASSGRRTPSETVLRYFEAMHTQDTKVALELLHEDFTFRDRAGTFAISRSAIRPILEWDAATHSRGEVSILETSGSTVRVHLRETNDFLELLGLGPHEAGVTFVVADGTVREIVVGSGAELQRAVEAAIAPIVDWAQATHPAKLAGLIADGTIVYDGRSASGWVALLAEARRAGVIGTNDP